MVQIYIYTIIIQNSKIISMIFKEISYANQGCVYFIKTTVKIVILWNIITI